MLIAVPTVSAKDNYDIVIHSNVESAIPRINISGTIEFDMIEFDLHITDMNGYEKEALSIGCLYRESGSSKWENTSRRSEFISLTNDLTFVIYTDSSTEYEVKFYRHVNGNVISSITDEITIMTSSEPILIISSPHFAYMENGSIIVEIDIFQFDGRHDDAYFFAEIASDKEFRNIVGRYFNYTEDYKIHSDFPHGEIVIDNIPKGKELYVDIYIETGGTSLVIREYCIEACGD